MEYLTPWGFYYIFSIYGLIISILAALLGSMMGLFFVAIFEYFLFKAYTDKKKITLLEEINTKLDKQAHKEASS